MKYRHCELDVKYIYNHHTMKSLMWLSFHSWPSACGDNCIWAGGFAFSCVCFIQKSTCQYENVSGVLSSCRWLLTVQDCFCSVFVVFGFRSVLLRLACVIADTFLWVGLN